MRPICSALLLATLAGPASAQDMRAQETARLDRFDAVVGQAVLAAMAGGSRGDVDLLQDALSGQPVPAFETTLPGDWICRTLKLGGNLSLVVYAPFTCRIDVDGTGFTLEKLTGSQLTRGTITLRDDRMIYLGVGYAAGADAPAYDGLPVADAGDGTFQPEVGVVQQTGPDTVRIMFPAPVVESDFDILYLTRQDS